MSNTQKTIMEKFSWLTPDMKLVDSTGDTIGLKGKALYSFEEFPQLGISQNNRKYVEDALLRGAQTLKGKPIDVNHQYRAWLKSGQHGYKPTLPGNVEFAYYEDGAVEYTAKINNKQYIARLKDSQLVNQGNLSEAEYVKKHGIGPIRGVSVDADFLWMKCPQCGVKHYNLEEYKRHLTGHGIKELTIEPHGIFFEALSLVEGDEVPGVKGTSFEIVETRGHMARFYEILVTDAQERFSYEEKKNMDKQTVETEKSKTEAKTEGSEKPSIASNAASESKEGLQGIAYIPTMLKELKATEKLSLSEPCDWSKFGYTSYDDCVSSNSDKGDPEAYCGSLKAKEKLEIARYNKMVEAINRQTESFSVIQSNLQNLLAAISEVKGELEKVNVGSQIKFDEAKEEEKKAQGELKEEWTANLKEVSTQIEDSKNRLGKVIEQLNSKATIETVNAEIKAIKEDAATKNMLETAQAKIAEQLAGKAAKETVDGQINKTVAEIAAMTSSMILLKTKELGDNVQAFKEDVSKEFRETRDVVINQKNDYEAILAGLDSKFVEYKRTMETRIQELKDEKNQLKETSDKTLQETLAAHQAEMEKINDRIDNVDHKVTPKLKGTVGEAKKEPQEKPIKSLKQPWEEK